MPNPLKDFAEWMKKGLDPMAISKKNTYSVMREFQDWVDNINIPDVTIHRDYLRDQILITHNHNYTTKTITRYEIEDSPAPRLLLIQAIGQLMNKTDAEVGKMIHMNQVETATADILNKVVSVDYNGTVVANPAGNVTGAIYVGNPAGNYWISAGSGGSGGALGAMANVGAYNMNGTIGVAGMIDDVTGPEDVERELLKKRLFNIEEQRELKNLKERIRHHFDQWRLAEEKMIPFNMEKVVIAGGCFVSFLHMQDPNDFDIFFLDDEYNRLLAKGLAESYQLEENVDVPIIKHPVNPPGANVAIGTISLRPKNKSKNDRVRIGNSNYMDNDKIEQTVFFKDSKMQYITTKYKTREELINHFDFKHCRVSYDYNTDKLFITRETYDLIKSKTLVPNKGRQPAMWRYEKFLERGWKKPEIEFL